ncbi:hypothetical protein PV327_005943 [Microctonus hyperodae]|uniref:MD-2-related lipid-recognition domain-containing protein n=1 Tax=Microctonus hyperodae TaxID=165561 RepID=A0AA39G2Q9_MICHY|nr:hypothetical protein PV327_005943 [Microctonus hyperodae]
MTSYNILVLFAIVAFVNSEIVNFEECTYPEGTPLNCTIHEVRVNPCKEAAESKPCRLKQPSKANISFDYTADFQGDTLETTAYWTSKVIDLPLLGMDTNACATTTCPVQPGQKQTYHIELPISKTFPSKTYKVKWRLWNAQEQECCFIFQLKLHK